MQSGGVPVGNDVAFRTLSSELGVVMAPQPVDTADSLGLSAFAVSADLTINTINTENWATATNSSEPSGVAPSLQIMGRKGLWPGLEIGAGATHLFDSRMWALGGYVKASFHEGFHHMPIPSIAARGTFSRLVGAQDMNMTTAAVDVSISHVFGIGKTFNITPYVGYQALFIFARSGVLDVTPGSDEFLMPTGESNEFVFKDSGAIVRHRPFLGARFIFSVMRIMVEAMIVPGGGSTGDIDGVAVDDNAGLQQQYTISLGLDF
ncbi:MAG: hypothetical protein R3A51_05375 [Nannocystaceae bacterium]|nr:hypothetical protein [Myxococcales bacterium]